MAENQEGTTARGATKRTGNRRKSPSQAEPRNVAAPKDNGPQGAAREAAPRKKAAPRGTAKKTAARKQISPEERYRMIQEAAYFKAEKEGFNCDPWKCWLVAEAEVDAQIGASH